MAATNVLEECGGIRVSDMAKFYESSPRSSTTARAKRRNNNNNDNNSNNDNNVERISDLATNGGSANGDGGDEGGLRREKRTSYFTPKMLESMEGDGVVVVGAPHKVGHHTFKKQVELETNVPLQNQRHQIKSILKSSTQTSTNSVNINKPMNDEDIKISTYQVQLAKPIQQSNQNQNNSNNQIHRHDTSSVSNLKIIKNSDINTMKKFPESNGNGFGSENKSKRDPFLQTNKIGEGALLSTNQIERREFAPKSVNQSESYLKRSDQSEPTMKYSDQSDSSKRVDSKNKRYGSYISQLDKTGSTGLSPDDFSLHREILSFSMESLRKSSKSNGLDSKEVDVSTNSNSLVKKVDRIDGANINGNDYIKERTFLKNWNPKKLIRELYKLDLINEDPSSSSNFINTKGYLEKILDRGRINVTNNSCKKKFYQSLDGVLFCYGDAKNLKLENKYELTGGRVEKIDNKILQLVDGSGQSLTLQSADADGCTRWLDSLRTQVGPNDRIGWIQPVSSAGGHPVKKVCIVEIGSCSIRAGVLGIRPSLPALFCPCLVAVGNSSGEMYFSFDALDPEVRRGSTLHHPLKPTNRIDKYTINWDVMPFVFESIFKKLNIDQSQYCILLSLPTNLTQEAKQKFSEILFQGLKVSALYLAPQSILSMYMYKARSGITVTIGDCIEIMPIYDGFKMDMGVSRLPFGGQKIIEKLNSALDNRDYILSSHVEYQIIRYAMEQMCFVSRDFALECEKRKKYRLRLCVDTNALS